MPTNIPLTSDPSQIFTVELESVIYKFNVSYNQRLDSWSFTLSDSDNNILLAAVPILIGPNLLKQYTLEIGALIVWDDEDKLIDATGDDDDLGTRVILTHFTEAEIAEQAAG